MRYACDDKRMCVVWQCKMELSLDTFPKMYAVSIIIHKPFVNNRIVYCAGCLNSVFMFNESSFDVLICCNFIHTVIKKMSVEILV